MGIVMQAQRRAIEDLVPKKKGLPKSIADANLCLRDKKDIYILGVSPGQGTCSDIHGMDVLVLATESPENGPRIVHDSSIVTCKYAVLLRRPTEDEVEKAQEYLCATSLMALELLEPIIWDENKIVFKATGEVMCYAQFA